MDWLKKKTTKILQDIGDIAKLTFRRLRLVKINRNFLVFLVFLGISTCFWCIQALDDGYEVELEYKLHIEDLPANQIYASAPPETFKVKIKGQGLSLLTTDRSTQTITINYNTDTEYNLGKVRIDNNAIRKAVRATLRNEDFTIVSITPSPMEFDVTSGAKKRVPVIPNIQFTLGSNRTDMGTLIMPDSLTIFATEKVFNQIKCIYTEQMSFKNVTDTTDVRIALKKEPGVKLSRDSVDIKLCVDIILERNVETKIYTENIPSNRILRTFPLKTTITFNTTSALKDKFSEKDFLVVVDYSEIKQGEKRAKLHLRMKPEGVSNVRLSPETVEFVIEQQSE